jgi:hypothetical protein
MLMLYNSDQYAVVQFDVEATEAEGVAPVGEPALTRGGYEIVDKIARKEIFIEGALAASFREGVDALIESSPTEEALDDFVGGYAGLMQQPVVMH